MAEVQIRKVEKYFGATYIIRGVDIDIEDGEFTVLVGPSGCGKSTLLRMIAGLEEISGGEILIGGRVVNNMTPKERDIAMVFQNYALYPHMTVRDNMTLPPDAGAPAEGAGRRAGAQGGRHPGPERPARPLSAPAVRRPAPACGDGTLHRARSAGVPVRRTAVQPRRQAARADAHRDQGAASAAEDHVDLCHARPDRGDDDGRQDRRACATAWSSRSARRWSSTTARPTSSWPVSSVRRR